MNPWVRPSNLYITSGSVAAGWAPWTGVSKGATKAGGAVAAVAVDPGAVALFLADSEGGIYATLRDV